MATEVSVRECDSTLAEAESIRLVGSNSELLNIPRPSQKSRQARQHTLLRARDSLEPGAQGDLIYPELGSGLPIRFVRFLGVFLQRIQDFVRAH